MKSLLSAMCPAEEENARMRAQLAQLLKVVRLLLDSEDECGRLSHNIGVPCGLCEAHKQLVVALARGSKLYTEADLSDAPKEEP